MGIMIYILSFNNGYTNPVYHVHKNVGAHYVGQNMVLFLKFRDTNTHNCNRERLLSRSPQHKEVE